MHYITVGDVFFKKKRKERSQQTGLRENREVFFLFFFPFRGEKQTWQQNPTERDGVKRKKNLVFKCYQKASRQGRWVRRSRAPFSPSCGRSSEIRAGCPVLRPALTALLRSEGGKETVTGVTRPRRSTGSRRARRAVWRDPRRALTENWTLLIPMPVLHFIIVKWRPLLAIRVQPMSADITQTG